jgi:hypothetical protein
MSLWSKDSMFCRYLSADLHRHRCFHREQSANNPQTAFESSFRKSFYIVLFDGSRLLLYIQTACTLQTVLTAALLIPHQVVLFLSKHGERTMGNLLQLSEHLEIVNK